jgi:acetyl-CoA C-acetyltransferase
MMATEVVLAGSVRTAIGRFGGALAETPAHMLGAAVIKEALLRAGIPVKEVGGVMMGCVLQAGLGQNAARQAAIAAGLPVTVPAETLNNVCGSGLRSVNLAAAMVQSGEADIVVAGGMESMSLAPYLLDKARFGYRSGDGKLSDSMIKDGLWDAFGDYHMGITAENLARRYGISRAEQDAFAAESQQKCEAARKNGLFDGEIVPLAVKSGKAEIAFSRDEYPRDGVTAEGISALRPAFLPDGTVTAANSSGINDGAAAVVVMSREKARSLGVKPEARWIGGSWAGVEPAYMGLGPVEAVKKLMERTAMSLDDFGLIEANEAFAAQAIAVNRELGWDAGRVNVNGGAIALGHPVGASGCRILVTLLHGMRRRGVQYGLATLCVGGGMGVAAAVERLI